jgi:hypothetical protein
VNKPYKVVRCDVSTGEIIGTCTEGTRAHCEAYLRRDAERLVRVGTYHHHYTLELQSPTGRILSWGVCYY